MSENQQYFNEALSDFMYDMASGGAIRQMATRGYSVDQIMKSLDFPTPRDRVEQTVYRHLRTSGILLEQLPVEESAFRVKRLYLESKRLSGSAEPSDSKRRSDGRKQSIDKIPLIKSLFAGNEKSSLTARNQLTRSLHEHVRRNGEENSYLLCPFGEWKKNRKDQLPQLLGVLNEREREYLLGIPFARNVMYHRLNGRMYEIAVKLVMEGKMEGRFFFLKEKIELRFI